MRTQFGNKLKLRIKYFGPYQVTKVKPRDRYDVAKIGDHEEPKVTGHCQGSHQELTKEREFSKRTLDAEVDDPGLKKEGRERCQVGTHQSVVHERDA
ncbi:hypothetical protein TNCV_3279681 [Trichonephila clavipes]|nr:hypothetical protein TNCV_3279681 [Trichonephila clavipes]